MACVYSMKVISCRHNVIDTAGRVFEAYLTPSLAIADPVIGSHYVMAR